jgi:hypothetical protein
MLRTFWLWGSAVFATYNFVVSHVHGVPFIHRPINLPSVSLPWFIRIVCIFCMIVVIDGSRRTVEHLKASSSKRL